MKQRRLTPSARADLLAIWEYIARDDVDAADRVLAEIEAAIAMLGRLPGLGHVRADLADERHRFWPVRSYLIVYRRAARGIVVVRVIHAARDAAALLAEEE